MQPIFSVGEHGKVRQDLVSLTPLRRGKRHRQPNNSGEAVHEVAEQGDPKGGQARAQNTRESGEWLRKVPRLPAGADKKSSRENRKSWRKSCAFTAVCLWTIRAMTEKDKPKVTLLFLAILPIGAWLAVIYFVLVLLGAATFSLELFNRLLTLT